MAGKKKEEFDIIGTALEALTQVVAPETAKKKTTAKKTTAAKKTTSKTTAKKTTTAKKSSSKSSASSKKTTAKKTTTAKKATASKKTTAKKLGKIILDINGKQIDFGAIEKKAAKLGGDVYVVANERKIYDTDGNSVDLF